MEIITKIINSYTHLLDFVNFLDLILSLFFLIFPKKREWQDYIICFYGGFLFGIIPLFAVLGDILAAFIGSVILSSVLIYLQNNLKTDLYLPLGIVVFKTLFIVAIALYDEQYSTNRFAFYLLLVFFSIVVFFTINIPYEIPIKVQHCIIRLFALLELSGTVVQIYRNEYSAFNKDLCDKEPISLFLYLLKVDYSKFDYQYLYIMCFVLFLLIYLILLKIISLFKTIWLKLIGTIKK